MSSDKKPRAHGQLNRGQVVTTYGPGAMVDLIEDAVLIAGLHRWATGRDIVEERLRRHLRLKTRQAGLVLREPPLDNQGDDRTAPGIAAFPFPRWVLAIEDKILHRDGITYRSRSLFPIHQLDKKKALVEGKRVEVAPIRFVRACKDGHLDDIDWHYFLFGADAEANRHAQLYLDEGGVGNDLTQVFVRCEQPPKLRALSEATLPSERPRLGVCRGAVPWLGLGQRVACDLPSELLLRGASNAYFAKTMTAISIPEFENALRREVAALYEDILKGAESFADLKVMLKIPKARSLAGQPHEAIWEEIRRIRGESGEESEKSLKDEELETLTNQPEQHGFETGEMSAGGVSAAKDPFMARSLRLDGLPARLTARLGAIVLVHRLREVIVQVGFSRFRPDHPDINGEYEEIKSPPLTPDGNLVWLPAVENQGEGIFLGFRSEAIETWQERPAVRARVRQLHAGFEAWKQRKQLPKREFPGAAYYLLHSLSHLLITAVSLECGYSATAIKERIYAGPAGYGILLYTGSPASEGTLGGLIEVGRHIDRNLDYALELGRMCSGDPVCAYHQPDRVEEERFLHGAACHGCLLISETCCEMGNDLLDRALVVPTVEGGSAAFFSENVS